jgi:DNA-binding transcriptional regulator GbsR (MarR family)
MDRKTIDTFVESWGTMGMLWGVNRSIARIHALLVATEGPLSLDEIASRLDISRGNTSMSLRELRNWGVIRRINVSGDRRDFYESEPDVWRMFFLIFGERKRREFDPALRAVRKALRAAEASDRGGGTARDRLEQMEDLLSTMDRVMNRFLASEKTSRATLRFLSGTVGEDTT